MTLPHMRDAAQSLRHWYWLISNYTERKLTNARDRLPAISGVARIVSKRFNWTYVAGLWSHDLEVALLWGVVEPDEPLSINVAHYSGPSWSWASTDRQMFVHVASEFNRRYPRSWFENRDSLYLLQDREWVSHYEVQSFSVELAGEDSFAEVKAGQLTIWGNIRPIPHPAVQESSLHTQPLVYSAGNMVEIGYKPDRVRSPQVEPGTNDAETWCLLAGFSKYRYSNDILCICYALVLQPVFGSTHTFRRIGLITFPRHVQEGERWDEAVDWLLAADTREIFLV
jgi:hypothetical protein